MTRPTHPSFPTLRMRRNRQHGWSRRMVRENSLSADDLILPIFLVDGADQREPVSSMPGVERLSVDLSRYHRQTGAGTWHTLYRAISLHRPRAQGRDRQRSAKQG